MMKFDKIKFNTTARTLIANFSYLSIIEIIGILLPLISYPYLIRIVGAQSYGVVVFAQAIISYMTIVVNFGFNVSATKQVSENRTDVKTLNKIYSSIIYLKFLLFIICCIILFLILCLIGYEYTFIVICFLGLCVQEVFYPTWLYQGLEDMKFITIITFLSKCSFLLLIFLFIHDADDYVYIPIFYSIGGILTSLVSIILVRKKFNINFVKVPIWQMKQDFRNSLPFFASRLSSVIMERTNVIAIGSFFSYEMVAVYDLCTKIVSILKTPYSLVAQVVYPNVSRNGNMAVIKKILSPLFLSGICLSLLVVLTSRWIVLFLGGEELYDAIFILKLMVWYVPFVGISYLFGASVLVVKNHSKEYNLSVVYSVLLYLIMMVFFYLFNSINLYTMTLTFLLPEIFISLYRVYIAKKYNLLT